MPFNSRHSFFILTLILCPLFSCNENMNNKKGVEAAMQQYDHLIQKMDMDSIALLYTVDGDMGTMAHGRDSIKKILSAFANYKVLSQSSVTTSIELKADSALQLGNYQQTVIVPAKDTVTVKGSYEATWLWDDKTGWHIKRMETKSTK